MSHRSVTRCLVKFGHALVAWETKKQGMVFHSSAGGEYWAMATPLVRPFGYETCCPFSAYQFLLLKCIVTIGLLFIFRTIAPSILKLITALFVNALSSGRLHLSALEPLNNSRIFSPRHLDNDNATIFKLGLSRAILYPV